MPATVDDVIAIAPQFSEEEPSRINYFLSQAALFINRTIWGPKADAGQAYLTAHFLASTPSASGGAAAAGPLASESVGGLSRSFAVPSMGNASDYTSTAYGRVFEQMKRTLLISPVVGR